MAGRILFLKGREFIIYYNFMNKELKKLYHNQYVLVILGSLVAVIGGALIGVLLLKVIELLSYII